MTREYKYGWVNSLPNPHDLQLEFSLPWHRQIPTSSDLTSKLSDPWNQGDLSDCVATAILEAYWALRSTKFSSTEWKLFTPPSFMFQFWNSRAEEDCTELDTGTTIKSGLTAISKFGVCPGFLWPLDESMVTVKPTDVCYASCIDKRAITPARIETHAMPVLRALTNGVPVIAGLSLFESWEDPDGVSKTGYLPLPKRGEKQVGGHCTVLVGHDSKTKRFLVRNSYGPDWGLKGQHAGDFWIPFEYIERDDLSLDFWVMPNLSTI